MADAKKNQIARVKVVTDKGVAVYPRVNIPDTKFNAKGAYSCKIRLPAEGAAKLIAIIEPMIEAQMVATRAALTEEIKSLKGAELVKAKKKLTDLKLADKSYKPALDEETGDETGEVEFNFKMNATYMDRKTQVEKTQAPALVDSKGGVIDPKQVAVWGGSVVQIGGYISPFYTAVGVGASLRLAQVRIIKLVTGNGGGDFDYGDEPEEGGFVAPAPKAASAVGDAPAAGETTGAEADDF